MQYIQYVTYIPRDYNMVRFVYYILLAPTHDVYIPTHLHVFICSNRFCDIFTFIQVFIIRHIGVRIINNL